MHACIGENEYFIYLFIFNTTAFSLEHSRSVMQKVGAIYERFTEQSQMQTNVGKERLHKCRQSTCIHLLCHSSVTVYTVFGQ